MAKKKQFEPKNDYNNVVRDFLDLKIDKTDLGEWQKKLAKRINVRLKDFENKGLTNTNGYRVLLHTVKSISGEDSIRLSQSKEFTNKTLSNVEQMINALSGEESSVGKTNKKLESALKIAKENGINLKTKDEVIKFRDFFKTEEWKTMCKLVGYGSAKDAVLRENSLGDYDTESLQEKFSDYIIETEEKPHKEKTRESEWRQITGESDLWESVFGTGHR